MINIFGYGVTTKPLVRFLNSLGILVRIYDDKFSGTKDDECGNTLLDSALFVDEGSAKATHANDTKSSESSALDSLDSLTHNSLKSAHLSIISPGIPPTHPLATKARNLIGEYDFFYRLLAHWETPPQSVWISGTNGKTTTTQMTTALLESFGARSGGNIGTPLSELYMSRTPLWVLETSSFSLHYTRYAAPQVYALLPVREDHITWHGSFEAYVCDKLSPLARMGEDSSAILPLELATHPLARGFRGRAVFYADSKDLAGQLGIEYERVRIQEPFLLDALIALGIAKILRGVCDIAAINAFKIGAHRIEEFMDTHNRLWVDDSKGTNVDASIEAVRRYQDRQIWLILGGDDKGADLHPLFRFMQGKAIRIFAIGSNAHKIVSLSAQYGVECEVCGELEVAVRAIKKMRNVWHSVLSDKSGNLRSDFQSLTSSKLLQSSLDNPLFSSQSLECQEGKPSAECRENTESKKGLESSLTESSADSESKSITQSITPKNLSEALPNINNSACASTSRAESIPIDSAIFATQKSNKYVGAIAPTTSRPLRGAQSLEQGGSSASATIALEAGKRGSLPVCRAEGLQAKRSKNSGGFFGALASGEGINPFFFCDTQDSKKQRNIRENASLRNLETSAENLESTESKADSKTITESKEILNNAQRQNLSNTQTNQDSQRDSESTPTPQPNQTLADVALLSPAAASLDQFSSYKERGDLFKHYALLD